MSKYEAELRRRRLSGEPIEKTRKWFVECIAKGGEEISYTDLTLQEQMFFDQTVDAFRRWLLCKTLKA